jgi:hypothetical protein
MAQKIKQWLLILLLAMAATTSTGTEDDQERLSDIIGRLYLNHRQLTDVYRKLHDEALNAVNGPEQQLSYIQKTYLFVNEANLICFYQWELLAVIDYIKDTHRSDYLTLRIKDLDRAIFESRDRVNSLKLYHAFIASDALRGLIEQATGLIEANIYMYEEVLELLKPEANSPNPFEKLLKDF